MGTSGSALDRRGYALQRICAWSGVVFIVTMIGGFAGFAGLVPPPSPGDSAAETAEYFVGSDIDRVRLGLIIAAFSACLLVPLSSVVAWQMRRTEGRFPLLSMIQFASGVLLSLEFIYLIFFWQTATFRTDRSDATIQLLNDMAWIPYMGLSCTVVMQAAAIGLAALLDVRARPVYPRWFGYYQLWAALMFTPGSFNVYFHDGPLAWDGLFAFWLPIPVYLSWCILTPIMTLKAIRQQEEEDAADDPEAGDLSATVTRLQADLDDLRSRLADR